MPAIADPDRRVLIAVDMESYSGRDNVLQYRAQLGFQKIMKEAAEELGFDRVNWLIQHGGDGELAILPPGTSERAIVTRLTPVVDRLLRDYNRGLAPEARIRLRIGVHEGLVHLDGASGFPGDAVVTVCRLVDSPQLKAVLRRFSGAAVALIVSDRIYQDVIRHYHDLRPEQFLRVLARLPEKNFQASAWIFVPGENAATAPDLGPGTTGDGPESGGSLRTGRDAERTSPDQPADARGSADTPRAAAVPQPPVSGQVFNNITANGNPVFGNGNTVNAVYGSEPAGPATDAHPER